MRQSAFRCAFPYTLPVMAGYLFLGFAFGLMTRSAGYPLWLPVLMSVCIYAGALEFAAVPLLAGPFNLPGTLTLGILMSVRHLFYGILMLKKYENTGWRKPLLIFCLTDETFSVSVGATPPPAVGAPAFYTWISLLDYFYWIAGTTLGALMGNALPFDLTGIDFSLTALFIVLFIERLKDRPGKLGGALGFTVTGVTLLLCGAERMMYIAPFVILALLFLGRRVIERE